MQTEEKHFSRLGAAACGAVGLLLAAAGCLEPPMQSPGYRTYRVSSVVRPASFRTGTSAAKTVTPEKSSTAARVAVPKSISPVGFRQSGQLEDLVSRIKTREADKAKAEESRRREERDRWLGNHEGEFASVRTRLKSMRIFAVTASDERLKARVREAIGATEAEIDALRARAGDGAIGFSEAAAIRTALQNRHEALAASSEEYRKIVK
ncbi:MAG: hypothetical protein J6Y19_02370 [Kiritimatiellae bacterium]|nr:hypothetical protein [Kiritimatiellia bacterium]